MPGFSANLGFLWTELLLPDAIRSAKSAGFDAVECHCPFDTPASEIREALSETGLSMLGLNTRRGDEGDNGRAALPDRISDARAAIDEAIEYACRIKAGYVHVMPGNAEGSTAKQTFIDNLGYACEAAAPLGLMILIEPLNVNDAPGYFLRDTQQAAELIAEVDAPNLKLMFDCYHAGRTEGDVIGRLRTVFPLVGHIQFAGIPDRGPPDTGEVDYRAVFDVIDALGWTVPIGAEYRPGGATETSLDWMRTLR